jgi:hypothetical protein
MATITRSTRRTETHPHSVRHANSQLIAAAIAHSAQNILQQNPVANRSKRPLDTSERDFDALKHKKTRFSVEILSKPPLRDATSLKVPVMPPAKPAVATVNPSKPPPALQINNNAAGLTKHQEKVINGIRHELHRLQPTDADIKEQGRKLRSQEATRFRSELSAYFPDYDEVIGNDPKEQREIPLCRAGMARDTLKSIANSVKIFST